MGDVADDAREAALRTHDDLAKMRQAIRKRCPQWDCEPRLHRDENGLFECVQCAEVFNG